MVQYITQLPAEILHNILGFVEPADLGRLLQTCRYLYGFVDGNSALCRDIYYRTLDEPASNDVNWEQELRDLVQLQRICEDEDGLKKATSLPFVYKTVTRILRNATKSTPSHPRVIHSLTYPPSRNASILSTLLTPSASQIPLLTSSFLFSRARGTSPPTLPPTPLPHHQQSAHLHCLYGSPILKHGRTRSSSMYPFACSKVYDLREYTNGSMWGPFWNDGSGRVDWEKVEAVMMVIGGNIRGKGLEGLPVFENFWGRGWGGSWEGSYVPWPAKGEKGGEGCGEGCRYGAEGEGGEEVEEDDEEVRVMRGLKERDPFGVSGTWLRVVCFLDYNDFFNYNFPVADELPSNVPRPALDVGEAIRLILMKVHVTSIETSENGSPIVHFTGFSRSLDGSWDDNADSDLRVRVKGTVQYTPEGEVRWTSYSIFSGEERWKSEGVQIGGARSARGVIGNWFDKDFDPHGPCGPTAFWKISDREARADDKQFLLHDFLPIVDGFEEDFDDPDFGAWTDEPPTLDIEFGFGADLLHYPYDFGDL
ncbi:hypothetical protein B0T14DRAFT_563058 [Immersiella caudata]|uniref:F-box domain-containing protein n=1 Tax=Immersiella caudata TaxID=314043 RepID=A0AA39X4N1_9PEZI|nr:hypothetical protein B0T14DRAFT_563058 [Immersiella caudata]